MKLKDGDYAILLHTKYVGIPEMYDGSIVEITELCCYAKVRTTDGFSWVTKIGYLLPLSTEAL